MQEAAKVAGLRDRAKLALKNAEIRKRKAALNTRVEELDPLAKKGKVNKDTFTRRRAQVQHHAPHLCKTPNLLGAKHLRAWKYVIVCR